MLGIQRKSRNFSNRGLKDVCELPSATEAFASPEVQGLSTLRTADFVISCHHCSRRPWRHLRAEALASETLTKRSCGAWAVPAPIRSSERVGHEMQLPILRHPCSQCSLKGSGRSTRRLPPGSVRSDVRARTGRDDSEGLGPGQIGVRESAAIPPAPDSVSIDPSADSASADYS